MRAQFCFWHRVGNSCSATAGFRRKHPRDPFNIRDLLAGECIDEDLRRAFRVYLLSSNRRMAEILVPKRKPIKEEFQWGFAGMTAEPVQVEELIAAREALVTSVVGEMSEALRHFLISFKRGEPDWFFVPCPAPSDAVDRQLTLAASDTVVDVFDRVGKRNAT